LIPPAEVSPPPVKSPCISVCSIDGATGYCTGCFRTLDEIAGWIDFSDDEKRRVWSALEARRARALSHSDGAGGAR
jgi:predicted Fe-S protein YdhL (DUF1289 family)